MSGERYTIIVSGERFEFNRDQILSDPGNYFATYFLGGFSESARGVRELVIDKEPLLFKLIQAHLRGYRILPLADTAIPSYMTKEQLEERIRRYMPNIVDLDTGTPLDPPPANSSPVKSAKCYKFGTKARGRVEWTINDTTPEGYQILFKDANVPRGGKRFVSTDCPNQYGFTKVISWADHNDAEYTLMESTPS